MFGCVRGGYAGRWAVSLACEKLMNSDSILPRLIEVSYGAAEKSRFLAFDATTLHLEQAAQAGTEILRRSLRKLKVVRAGNE